MIGRIDFIPFEYLPDRGPFTSIFAHRCVAHSRSFCESQMLIDADVTGLTEPGNYVLARLDYTRWGFAELTCGQWLWPQAVFEASCWFPSCANPNDPRTTMTLESDVTSTPESALTSWGQMKALYR